MNRHAKVCSRYTRIVLPYFVLVAVLMLALSGTLHTFVFVANLVMDGTGKPVSTQELLFIVHEQSVLLEELSAVLDATEQEVLSLEQRLEEVQYENDMLRTIPAVVTAYAPLDPTAVEGMDYEGDPSVTATGTTPRVGVCAADLSKIPAGTVLYVPGYGEAVVEDTGGAMRSAPGILIDVVFDTRKEAYSWGRKALDVTIVSVPDKE